MRIRRAVSLLSVTLGLVASLPSLASADTLHLQTPWVVLRADQSPCQMSIFGNSCKLLKRTAGYWTATCPAGYTFELAPGAATDPVIYVPDPIYFGSHRVELPYWWSGNQLNIHAFYTDLDRLDLNPDPEGVPIPNYPHLWGRPQDYLCEQQPAAKAAASVVSVGVDTDSTTHHETMVRHLTRTFALRKNGRLHRRRLACPAGEKLISHSSAIGSFRRKRPSVRDHRLIKLRHLRMSRHIRVDARASSKLAKTHQLQVQLRISCQVPAA